MRQAREVTTQARAAVPELASAAGDVFDRAERAPGRPMFARKAGGDWRPVTAAEFAREVRTLAAGLVAAGIRPGDRVALMSGTSYEWALCDMAIWAAGAVTVPIYETSSTAQAAWILQDSGATAIFTGNEQHQATAARTGAQACERMWRMDRGGLQALAAAGTGVPPAEVERRLRATRSADPATIVYTSGTTGQPKGCVLSHAAMIGEVRSIASAEGVSEQLLTPASSILLFLPLAHILARVVQLAALHNGSLIGHTSDLRHLAGELASFRPTIVLGVPRVFETLYHTAARKAARQGQERIFRAAEAAAIAYSEALAEGRAGWWVRARRQASGLLVYRKLRSALGGRVEFAVCGGAPLQPRLTHFLRGAGILVLEGYGLTETCSAVSVNLPTALRIGTVGRPLPGWSVRIASNGEVLVKGPGMQDGYWHNERATAEVMDSQGWLHTGDLGRLDDGFLTITGRTKDMIVTAGGKNVSPGPLEDRLRAHWLIDQCVVVGDRRPFVGALVTLDRDALTAWKREHSKPEDATAAELAGDSDLQAEIQQAIGEVNQDLSRAEAIRRFRILAAEFTVGDELTPTQKIRRQHVLTKYGEQVSALYGEG
jgi:long-chain acyl-CoA synthetase